ncbi:hypothetical protein, partial [Halpernia humi]|uniref:hypothetical protein n=1 Tax=Halpernia humi TaxID=493375 RepID=UPI001C88A81C
KLLFQNASKATVVKTSCECNDGFTTVGEAEPYVGKNRPEGRFFPTFRGFAFGRDFEAQKLILLLNFN